MTEHRMLIKLAKDDLVLVERNIGDIDISRTVLLFWIELSSTVKQ